MTVWVVTCTDPADHGHECWAQGVYRTEAQARRVRERLIADGYWTVRINRLRLRGDSKCPDEARA